MTVVCALRVGSWGARSIRRTACGSFDSVGYRLVVLLFFHFKFIVFVPFQAQGPTSLPPFDWSGFAPASAGSFMLLEGQHPPPSDLLPLVKRFIDGCAVGTLCSTPKFAFHKIAKMKWRNRWAPASTSPVAVVVGVSVLSSSTTLASAFESNACKNCHGKGSGSAAVCQFSFVAFVFNQPEGKLCKR